MPVRSVICYLQNASHFRCMPDNDCVPGFLSRRARVAERCHGCLSCSRRRPLQTWLILCSPVNRTICLWAASELISAKHHFLEDEEEMLPAGYKSVPREMNRVPAPGSLGFCLRWRIWWQPSWISRELGGRGGVPKSLNIHWKLSSHRNLQKHRASVLCSGVLSLFALSRASLWQQTSICSCCLLFLGDTLLSE